MRILLTNVVGFIFLVLGLALKLACQGPLQPDYHLYFVNDKFLVEFLSCVPAVHLKQKLPK